MRSSKRSAVTLALAALAPGLNGCAEIAGLEDRQVIQLMTIAENQAAPRAIALDEEAIYWINTGNDGSQGSFKGGALRRQIKDDWAVIDLLGPSDEVPDALALDATHVYWSSTDAAFIKDDCDPDAGDTRDKLLKLPKAAPIPAAGGEMLWGSCGAATAIALSADNVYSARPNANRITSVSKQGGSRTNLTEGGKPRDVVIDGSVVYWTDPENKTLSVIDISGDAPKKDLFTELEPPGLLALDEANLYWLHGNNVMRLPRSGADGDAAVLLLDKELPSAPAGIATYGDYLYITVQEAKSVYRLRKDGAGGPQQIAANQEGPTGIAADGTGVYWTNSGSGQIVRFNDE
jgi:sugar lactone lactonase YvrE